MTRYIAAAALCLILAACGGGDAGNAAVGKIFTYAAPATATSSQLSAAEAQVSGALSLKQSQSSLDVSASESLGDVTSITDELLGSSGADVSFATAPTSRTALTIASGGAGRFLTTEASFVFENPGCVTQTLASVKLDGCTVTLSDQSDPTTTGKVTANGFASITSSETLKWDLTVGVTFTKTGSGGGSIAATAHRAGTLTVTETEIKGSMLGELSASATIGGASDSLAVSESVELATTYQTNPTCVTGGTLEAKRVWTKRPGSGGTYADKGALVTWTGCGIGTIALSR
jgi:hypothetical protein